MFIFCVQSMKLSRRAFTTIYETVSCKHYEYTIEARVDARYCYIKSNYIIWLLLDANGVYLYTHQMQTYRYIIARKRDTIIIIKHTSYWSAAACLYSITDGRIHQSTINEVAAEWYIYTYALVTTDITTKYTITITTRRAPGTTCINTSIPDTASTSAAHYTRHPTRQRPWASTRSRNVYNHV